MAATDARPVPIKNTAFRAYCDLRLNTGAVNSSPTGLDSEVSIDGAAFSDATNEWTEIGSTGHGYLDLTSGEMNGDAVTVQIKSSTANAVTRTLVIYPQEAGDIKVDLETVKTQSVTCGAGVTVLASVGTAATSTAQTGDAFARLGAPAGASVSADIAAIEAQTDDIGVAGAGLTAVPWNAAWDAEVQSEVADALAVYDPPTNAEMEARTLAAADYATAAALTTVDTVVDAILADTGTDGVVVASLANNSVTAAALAADAGTEIGTAVWATAARTLTAGTNIVLAKGTGVTGFNDITAASVWNVDIADAITNSGGVGEHVITNLDATISNIPTDVWSEGTRTITGGTIGTITGLTIANAENMATRFLTMIELDGAVYRYTTNALEQGAAGGSGATAQEVWEYATRILTAGTNISIPTAAQNADAVWDEATADHATSGTFGAAMAAAGSAGDPWETTIPGAYAAGTAGYLLGTTVPGLLQDAEITLSSAVSTDGGTVTITRGDDYEHSTSPATSLSWTFTGVPSLTGATVLFKMNGQSDRTMTVASATSAYLELNDTETTAMSYGDHTFSIVATLADTTTTRTLANGTVQVRNRSAQ